MAKNETGSVNTIYWVTFLASLAIFAVGVYRAAAYHDTTLLATGLGCIIAVSITWPIAAGVRQNRQASEQRFESLVTPLNERLQQLSIMLNLISEQQLLSDRAKSVAFREKDREALRRAIQEEIAKHDYEAAGLLADDMERSFGYRQEAERFRGQINEHRNEAIRKHVAEAATVVDRHVRAERWQDAHREADNLLVKYPDVDQVKNLPNEINARREQHKQQLIESLREADSRHDADGGVEILKKLDGYLTASEAEGMQDIARRIFKHKLENLRTQFSMAVHENRWQEAIRLGDIVIRDFPNTQMAKEVRDAMTNLQMRASGLEPVSTT